MITTKRALIAWAWDELLSGAESMWEDWIDEDGRFTEDEGELVDQLQGSLLEALKRMTLDEVEALVAEAKD